MHDETKLLNQCWVISDGKQGHRVQSRALAAEYAGKILQYDIIEKSVSLGCIFKKMPLFLWGGFSFGIKKSDIHKHFAPPYPKIIISCGRQAAGVALRLKKLSKGRIKIIQLLNPLARHDDFDAIILPKHDRRDYKNACYIDASFSEVGENILKIAKEKWESKFSAIFRLEKNDICPIVGLLIGGKNKIYPYSPQQMTEIYSFIDKNLHEKNKLIITTSRRTPDELYNKLLEYSYKFPHDIYVWDGMGDNPYFGILAVATHIVCTPDSINMMSDSIYSNRPSYIFDFKGEKNRNTHKFQRFIDLNMQKGRLQYLDKFDATAPFKESDKKAPAPMEDMKNTCDLLQQSLKLN